MTVHITKTKGDLAVFKTMVDLAEKGFKILLPTVSEHLPFDLVVYKDQKFLRVQVKYCSRGEITNRTHWSSKSKTHTKKYKMSDFDYYALYCPDIEKILYPSIKFGGAKISTKVNNSYAEFYWWEDFLEFTDEAAKKQCSDFSVTYVSPNKGKKSNVTEKVIAAHIKSRKVIRPEKDVLEKLLWEKPTIELAKQFGVSDVAVTKWAKLYKLPKPPRGYWAKKYASDKALSIV